MKIVFLDAITLGDDVSLEPLKSLGDLTMYDNTSEDQINERIAECEVLIVNKVEIKKDNIDHASKLKLICEAATGIDNIDHEYAKSKNILVKNVKGYSTESVAEVTMMLMLNLAGHGIYFDDFVKSGKYSKSGIFTDVTNPFFELKGKKLGIIGMGSIGQRVAEIATVFGMKISYYSTSGTSHCTKYPSVSINELLAESDIISINAPMNEKTNNLLTYNMLSKMKSTAYIINIGRGGIINETDLVKALNDNKIAAAGIDVFTEEPIGNSHPYLSELKDKSKIILTPHIGWTSLEARNVLINMVADNIRNR
ncbi:MAG: D-2-hydroxyacid dehydrogenase [Bacteroidales bacterium]